METSRSGLFSMNETPCRKSKGSDRGKWHNQMLGRQVHSNRGICAFFICNHIQYGGPKSRWLPKTYDVDFRRLKMQSLCCNISTFNDFELLSSSPNSIKQNLIVCHLHKTKMAAVSINFAIFFQQDSRGIFKKLSLGREILYVLRYCMTYGVTFWNGCMSHK